MLEKIFPNYALKRREAQFKIKELKAREELADSILNYEQTGASQSKIAFRNSYDYINTVDEDTGDTKEVLTARSIQLFQGNSVARAAIEKVRTNVVGRGIKPKARVNAKILEISDSEAEEIQTKIQILWDWWAESTECDITRIHNFYQLQSLAMMTYLIEGECFALLPYRERKGEIFQTKIKFIDGARCQNQANTEYLKYGVEFNDDQEPIAYHFKNTKNEYKRIPTFSATGRRNIIHIFEKERVGQRRGVPLLAPVIETLLQITRYTHAELMNAVISSLFTVFITSDKDTPTSNKIGGLSTTTNPRNPDEKELSLGSGNLLRLEPGERLEFANPGRPHNGFEIFMNVICKHVGAALGIPHEVLLSSFNASYSASRASLLEVWKMYNMRRSWLVASFCQPIYETFLDEIVDRGLIELKGYRENALKRKAYTRAEWYGQSQGQLDPLKEVRAAREKIEAGLSTVSRESIELNGSDSSDNFEQRKIEIKKQNELNKLVREGRKDG